jgi:glycosyltransferase involved in cell wall biosynthesis
MMDGVSPYLGRKHQLTIYSVSDESLPDQEVRSGIKYIRFPREQYVEEVCRSLKKNTYDVVHVFNRPVNVLKYKAASPSSRFVLSLHNEMFADNKITDEEANLCVQYVHKITTVSNFIKKTVTDRVPAAENKIVPIYSGFDPDRYYPVWTARGKSIREQLRKRYGIQNKKVILFVGRLSVKKGPHLLIQAMKRVLKKHSDAVLVIVGGKWFSDDSIDDYGKWMLKLAKPYKSKVIFTKFVPANEIQNYFSMGDVFVCSSQWQEPLARVHYEAMAAGVPVITTDRGGNAEVIKHKENGYIVRDYTSSTSFAKAINYMLTKKEKAMAMAQKGRQLVDSNYTFEHVANRLNNIYMKAYSDQPTSFSALKTSKKKDVRMQRKRKRTALTRKKND